MDNVVSLVGNLTRDPELRYTTGGSGVCSFGMACTRKWKDKRTDEWVEDTSFFNVTAWADLGEHVAESLSKGARVMVFGRLDQRSYETREGEKRNVVEVVADAIGPDLRWATATVVKVERDGYTSRSGGSTKPPADPVYGDEEPF